MKKAAAKQSDFGPYLKETREKLGLSLRRVQELSNGTVHNAYLSQIENGRTKNPNPDLLAAIAKVYGLDFWNLLHRAGWPIPREEPKGDQRWRGSPLRDLMDLSDEEMEELLDFAGYLRRKRQRKASASK
jgi:transcriptional regulator with XRE-family HTH domain